MLFVIVMEVLNSLIAEADRRHIFAQLPGMLIQHRASLYADDLVVFLAPTIRDLRCLRAVLDCFAGASGLVTNVDKCLATPIRCSKEDIAQVQQIFPCRIAPFPCRYLGVPLSIYKLRHAQDQPIIDVVARKIPFWKSGLLTSSGRALLTKVTLSAVPIHVSILTCLSPWATERIDKIRRAFLWTGKETAGGGHYRLAWQTVCSPTNYGGLGMIDLRPFGFALRLRWEWLKRVKPDKGWARLPAKQEHGVHAMFIASCSVQLGDGKSASFWNDKWLPVGSLRSVSPYVYQASSRARRSQLVHDAIVNRRWVRDITGATTLQVLVQFLRIWELVRETELDPLRADRFVWRWAPDGSFSVSSTYRAFFIGSMELLGAKEIWHTRHRQK
jgi:hypothetical protein